VAAVKREQIDVLIAGVTGGPGRKHAQEVFDAVMERVLVPLVAVYGSAR
jgi:hypothetical protein